MKEVEERYRLKKTRGITIKCNKQSRTEYSGTRKELL